MKKLVIAVVVVAALAGGAFYSGLLGNRGPANAQADGAAAAGGNGAPGGAAAGAAGGRRGGGAGGRGGFGAVPLTVETAPVVRATMAAQLTVVGNLIGDATVAIVPKTAGRLQDVAVRLGDQVTRGQRIAKIEDQEIAEQVRQAEAAFEVSRATIRQREADLALAKTNVERARSLFQRQLLPQQTLDDNESRYQAAMAQLDLARAQNNQSQARLDELRITLSNTTIVSPVEGFIARRAADPGAFVSNNAPVVDIVDIRRVRLVVNVVEKDLRQVKVGDTATVGVDAFPGETFTGRIARVAPVLDPATRTAPIEIEIPNPTYRLKPGMYARVRIETDNRKDALVVPTNALVDFNGRRGVFLTSENNAAIFRPVQVGIEEAALTEVLEGVSEGDRIITTGAAGLTNGARYVLLGGRGGRGGGRGGRNGGGTADASAGGNAPAGAGPAVSASAGPAAAGTRAGQARPGGEGAQGAGGQGGRRGGFRGDGSGAPQGVGGEGGRRGGFRRGGAQAGAPGGV